MSGEVLDTDSLLSLLELRNRGLAIGIAFLLQRRFLVSGSRSHLLPQVVCIRHRRQSGVKVAFHSLKLVCFIFFLLCLFRMRSHRLSHLVFDAQSVNVFLGGIHRKFLRPVIEIVFLERDSVGS